jgi:hypothetical protein
LQALRTLRYPDLNIQLHRVALTRNQVVDLPSTPLNPKEKRRAAWEAAMGRAQTEIDALMALQPRALHQMALEAVRPFFDFSLEERCRQAGENWLREAEAKIDGHPAQAAMRKKLKTAHIKIRKAVGELHRIRDDGYAELKEQLGIEDSEIPAPEAQITVSPPTPLFTTEDDFVTASRKLITEKKYEFEEDEEDNSDC